ncbi:carbonate dehydratase [Simiduia agarivorans]|uniref:Carbonic anhydrase n=1 Tax=Simiduia agarivorans (strain DSM 21679 / JCM 13881 / BCRC 17597 / SA1) TaxID=1117647 RepID=K4KQ99_SIMAS|nr:carbonate dehydratase [Simiduia agarivorans]AFV00294.1 Carbonate dehydratase [Simiduia agarivorans SA1 = DSM 21679]
MCEKCSLKHLLDNNDRWARDYEQRDPSFFPRLAAQQKPDYLWIGCSDARVPANDIVGLEPGELFVHRNIANQLIHTDFNGLSVVQFALDHLKVKHIIVCGHYGCGGVRAALDHTEMGLVDNWLRHIKDIFVRHKAELVAIADDEARVNRLCELNVMAQVENLSKTKVVQRAWRQGRSLSIHGWIYGLQDGRIVDLDVTVNRPDGVDDIYRMSPG